MALLLIILKIAEANFIVFSYKIEFLIGFIAIIFTGLGIWLAQKLTTPKVEVKVVEKKIFLESQKQVELNYDEIKKRGISKRELEVLNLMAQGMSNEEIADNLFVSLNTIKTHASNLFVKLDVKRRTQAMEKAKRLSIIE